MYTHTCKILYVTYLMILMEKDSHKSQQTCTLQRRTTHCCGAKRYIREAQTPRATTSRGRERVTRHLERNHGRFLWEKTHHTCQLRGSRYQHTQQLHTCTCTCICTCTAYTCIVRVYTLYTLVTFTCTVAVMEKCMFSSAPPFHFL